MNFWSLSRCFQEHGQYVWIEIHPNHSTSVKQTLTNGPPKLDTRESTACLIYCTWKTIAISVHRSRSSRGRPAFFGPAISPSSQLPLRYVPSPPLHIHLLARPRRITHATLSPLPYSTFDIYPSTIRSALLLPHSPWFKQQPVLASLPSTVGEEDLSRCVCGVCDGW